MGTYDTEENLLCRTLLLVYCTLSTDFHLYYFQVGYYFSSNYAFAVCILFYGYGVGVVSN